MKMFLISAGFIIGLTSSAAAQGTPVSPNPDYPVYVQQNGIEYFCRPGLTTLPDGRPARLCRRLTDLLAGGAGAGAGGAAAVGGVALLLAVLGGDGGGSSGGTGTD
ncbi:hypothetical protein [Marinovum sp.]|uniref:hypothetical protein n=1 Tax=Marinovum sp. TaxID=2024839 RepID=UPI003A8CE9B2